MTELSDELLVAYVDGQLERKQSRAVERVLEQDDVIARRVHALKDAHSRLEAAFEAVLAGEETIVEPSPEPPGPGIFITWRNAAKVGLAGAGLVVALVLAIAGYGWPLVLPSSAGNRSDTAEVEWTGSLPATWQDDVVHAQTLLSRETLSVSPEGQANQDLIGFQLAQAIGPGLKLPDLKSEGFRFMREQLLRAGDEPVAQVLYLGASGAPLALYAKKGEGAADRVFKSYREIGSVSWSEDGIVYLLAGELNSPRLTQLADTIKAQADAPKPSALNAVVSVSAPPPPPPPRPPAKR
jgi:anti-sigma factor RsiW